MKATNFYTLYMKKYYYHNGTTQLGPFSIEDIKKENITRKTKVWCEGMKEWQTAETISELQFLFTQTPPEIKTQTPPEFNTENQIQKNNEDNHKVILAILCFMLGVLGIHRFYISIVDFTKNNTGGGILHLSMGLLQLLTLGGLGIWAIVDFILILTGWLRPKY